MLTVGIYASIIKAPGIVPPVVQFHIVLNVVVPGYIAKTLSIIPTVDVLWVPELIGNDQIQSK